MTSAARQDLIRRSMPIEAYGNMKLELNGHKPDNWREMNPIEQLLLLKGETDEIRDDILAWENYGTDVHGKKITLEEFRENLLKEIGDAYNCLRFIADKYGCLEAP